MTERNGTIRNGAAVGAKRGDGGVFSSAEAGSAQRSSGGFGGKPPLKGGGFPPKNPETDGEMRSAGEAAKRQEMASWVASQLPTCASVASTFRAEFGEVRMIYAAENGHVLGDEHGGRQPCNACIHYFTRLLSPDGGRKQRACRLYRYAANHCADYREAK